MRQSGKYPVLIALNWHLQMMHGIYLFNENNLDAAQYQYQLSCVADGSEVSFYHFRDFEYCSALAYMSFQLFGHD